jgi:soluble lytic murein transglycosylase-like protein
MTEFAYRAEVHTIAAQHHLDPNLVVAVCLHESAGKTSAYRYEPAFWLRYMAKNPRWDGAVPERVSASYGLLQVMYPVALELGMPPADPPEYLFVPVYGLQYGCRKLREVLGWAKGDVPAALAAYNGGKTKDNAPGVDPKRNQRYVDQVLLQLAMVNTQT